MLLSKKREWFVGAGKSQGSAGNSVRRILDVSGIKGGPSMPCIF